MLQDRFLRGGLPSHHRGPLPVYRILPVMFFLGGNLNFQKVLGTIPGDTSPNSQKEIPSIESPTPKTLNPDALLFEGLEACPAEKGHCT